MILFAETRAKIRGPSEYIHSGSTLKLSCRVYLGPQGPDQDYASQAVIHWFHEQRLLDPELERWRSGRLEPRILTNTEIGPNGIQGWLEILRVTPFDSGNYTCVPSYAIPAWINIVVLPGTPIDLLKLITLKIITLKMIFFFQMHLKLNMMVYRKSKWILLHQMYSNCIRTIGVSTF